MPTGSAMMDAPTAEVEETIQGVTWPEQKAPRLQAVLRAVAERHGSLSLDFLGAMPVDGGAGLAREHSGHRAEDERGGAVVLGAAQGGASRRQPPSPRRPAHRAHPAIDGCRAVPCGARRPAAARIGMRRQVYDHHEVMMLHGQRCCFFKNPACGRCAILDLCPTGQGRMHAKHGRAARRSAASDRAPVQRSEPPHVPARHRLEIPRIRNDFGSAAFAFQRLEELSHA